MNIIGEVGNFIIKYQDEIQTGLIVLLCALVVFMIGKAFSNSRKKRLLLSQINETVSEINANVKSLGEKRTEVIYIDGKAASEARTASAMQEVLEVEPVAEGEATPMKTVAADQPAPSHKYFSRDCGVSKDGRQYTEEELNAQIKE